MSARVSLPSAIVSPKSQSFNDPPVHLIDAAAMDYLLIELVNTLRASSAVATARTSKIEQEMVVAGLIPSPTPQGAEPSSTRTSRVSAGKSPLMSEEDEGLRVRLEGIGLHVGANFTERLCRDRPLFSETLDAVKFICKDLWAACWDKQVDNLRTNHRGVYVLQDNHYKPISRLSSWRSHADALKRARLHVALSGGIIKGALSRLGFQATVIPEITSVPQCTFQIKLPKGI